MKFATKIFISLFLLSVFIAVVMTFLSYSLMKDTLAKNYESRYRALSVTVSDTLTALEQSTERSMKTSLNAITEHLSHMEGIPTNEGLKVLRDGLGMSSIEIVRKDGEFIRSTDFPTAKSYNLFSFCDKYRNLFNGQSSYERTPLMPSAMHGRVTKYSLIPLPDRKYALNVGFEVDFLGKTLTSALRADKNIASIGFYTPSGVRLGQFSNQSSEAGLQEMVKGEPRGISYSNGYLIIETQVPSEVRHCCECATKKLTLAGTDEFFYTLRMAVSLGDLHAAIASLRWTLLLIMTLLILVSYFAASWLASRLVSKIGQVNQKTEQIMNSKDLSVRINLTGTDEIASMAHRFDRMLEILQESQKELVQLENDRAFASVANQVAHDIRSPLTALDVISHDVDELAEDKRILIRSAVSRIKDIANNLLVTKRNFQKSLSTSVISSESKPSESPSVQLLPSLIETLVSEKRVQFRSNLQIRIETNFDANTYGIFSSIELNEFKRILSNLIDNSVEASLFGGNIEIRLSAIEDQILISVTDTGRGIPASILPKLAVAGETYGKTEGSGLGLHHAKVWLERWGGALRIISKEGKGTTVFIMLPRVDPPSWFVPRIELETDSTIVVVDDDTSIHQIWQRRFEALTGEGLGPKILHFSTAAAFHDWLAIKPPSACSMLFLVDYEIRGEVSNGLDIIESAQIQDSSILVTSHYEECQIRERCKRLGVRLIPKAMAGFVPITISSHAGVHQMPVQGHRESSEGNTHSI